MTTLTRLDISRDMAMLTGSLQDRGRPLVSRLSAMKMALSWPLACILGYVVAFFFLWIKFVPEMDSFGNFSHIGDVLDNPFVLILIASFGYLIFFVSLYHMALIYLTLDERVRESSVILSHLKTVLKRTAVASVMINWMLALACCLVSPDFFIGSVAMVLLTGLVTQLVISAEIARFGIGDAMQKLSELVRKI